MLPYQERPWLRTNARRGAVDARPSGSRRLSGGGAVRAVVGCRVCGAIGTTDTGPTGTGPWRDAVNKRMRLGFVAVVGLVALVCDGVR